MKTKTTIADVCREMGVDCGQKLDAELLSIKHKLGFNKTQVVHRANALGGAQMDTWQLSLIINQSDAPCNPAVWRGRIGNLKIALQQLKAKAQNQ